jgi:hypothetical protein
MMAVLTSRPGDGVSVRVTGSFAHSALGAARLTDLGERDTSHNEWIVNIPSSPGPRTPSPQAAPSPEKLRQALGTINGTS